MVPEQFSSTLDSLGGWIAHSEQVRVERTVVELTIELIAVSLNQIGDDEGMN